jgi:hypothetical protein
MIPGSNNATSEEATRSEEATSVEAGGCSAGMEVGGDVIF